MMSTVHTTQPPKEKKMESINNQQITKALSLAGLRFATHQDIEKFMRVKGRYKYAKAVNLIVSNQGVFTHQLINSVYTNNIPDCLMNAQKRVNEYGIKLVKATQHNNPVNKSANWYALIKK